MILHSSYLKDEIKHTSVVFLRQQQQKSAHGMACLTQMVQNLHQRKHKSNSGGCHFLSKQPVNLTTCSNIYLCHNQMFFFYPPALYWSPKGNAVTAKVYITVPMKTTFVFWLNMKLTFCNLIVQVGHMSPARTTANI